MVSKTYAVLWSFSIWGPGKYAKNQEIFLHKAVKHSGFFFETRLEGRTVTNPTNSKFYWTIFQSFLHPNEIDVTKHITAVKKKKKLKTGKLFSKSFHNLICRREKFQKITWKNIFRAIESLESSKEEWKSLKRVLIKTLKDTASFRNPFIKNL